MFGLNTFAQKKPSGQVRLAAAERGSFQRRHRWAPMLFYMRLHHPVYSGLSQICLSCVYVKHSLSCNILATTSFSQKQIRKPNPYTKQSW